MSNKKITITIDGPVSSGKGTTSKLLAQRLGYKYIDSGAIYRVVAMVLDRQGISADDIESIKEVLEKIKIDFADNGHALLDGEDVETEIRTPRVSQLSSIGYSGIPAVRSFVTETVRALMSQGGYILDGRDAGSVIYPQAELKIYLDASVEARAERRAQQYGLTTAAEKEKNLQDIIERDEFDKNKEIGRLQILPDAVVVDTTDLTIDEQVDQIYQLAQKILNDEKE